jgi:peptide/nickel transport system substrate-binding protein
MPTPLSLARRGLSALALATLMALPAAAADIRIGLQEDPDILDPHEARTFVGRIVFNALCDKMIDTDEKLEFVPRLATSWTVSDGGKTVTFKLRAGVTFHDGTPFDAAAVKANIARAQTSQTSRRKSEIKSVTAVEVIDPTTVAFKLSAPDAPLLAQLSDRAGMMLSPASFDKPVGAKPICSGPYKFVERVQNDRIVLERFADHWEKDKYSFDKVIFRTIPDSTVRLANLRSGQLDMLERLAASDVAGAKSDAGLKVVSVVGLGYQGISININNGARSETPLGKDKRVRQALSLAIDREALNQVVFEGLFEPTIQPFPSSSPYYDKGFPPP